MITNKQYNNAQVNTDENKTRSRLNKLAIAAGGVIIAVSGWVANLTNAQENATLKQLLNAYQNNSVDNKTGAYNYCSIDIKKISQSHQASNNQITVADDNVTLTGLAKHSDSMMIQ